MKKRIIAFLCLCVMVLSIFPCVPEKALAAEEFYELKNGQVITLKNASSGWFMNLQHGTDANGTKINVYPWDETPPYTQKYKVSLNADGSFKLATLCAPSRFLDVRRYSKPLAESQGIVIWAEDGDTHKHLRLKKVGDKVAIVFANNTNLCIAPSSVSAAKTTQTQMIVRKLDTSKTEMLWNVCDEKGNPINTNVSTTQYLYVGTLDISSTTWTVYVPDNKSFEMNGGAAGEIKQGSKLYVINEKTNSKGNLVAYVYSEDLKVNCYVTAKFIKKIEENNGSISENEEIKALRKQYGDALDSFIEGLDDLAKTGMKEVITPVDAVKLFISSAQAYWTLGEALSLAGESINEVLDTETIWYKNLYQTHSEIMAMLVNQVNKGGSFSEDLLNSATATVNESKAFLREDILKNRNKQYNIFVRDAFDDLLEKVDTIEVDYNKVYKDIGGEYYNSQSLLNKIRSRELIIEVAENEYTKYGKTKAEGADYSTGQWCVSFCSWCAKTAGIPSEVMPLNGTNVWIFKNDVLNRGGKYYDTNTDYIPRPGDFVIYGTKENHNGHIGLIVEVDVEAKMVTTIEGNTSKENGDGTVGYLSKKWRSFNSDLVSGWLSPNY